MTGRERFYTTLKFIEPDRPPHFEAMFELEREAFGLSFPDRNSWAGCTAEEKKRKIAVCCEIYERIVERFQWDALVVYCPWSDPDGVAAVKKTFGDRIAIGGMVGEAVHSIDTTTDWMAFAGNLAENRKVIHQEAEKRCCAAMDHIAGMVDAGADFLFIASDVAFNGGPFVSPADFKEIVTPYLARVIDKVREKNAIAILHSDGDLMPVLDQILDCKPHVLMSIDPMAGMDIAEVKKITCGKMALMGNVQCSLLQDGPEEAIRASVLYCLEYASPGGGYIFSTSNTVFPGMPLENYEYMLAVYREFCRK
ncbi:MAG: uroporphyrinogen decarboxylase family protein [Candidatus Omnitrophota bacterium]